MVKYIIVIEIPKLNTQIPIRIRDTLTFFIFPVKFRKYFNSGFYDIVINHNNVKKDQYNSSYIIFKTKLDPYLRKDVLLAEVEKELRPLIQLFSLLLREIFYIKKLYIIETRASNYKLIRLIKKFRITSSTLTKDQMINYLSGELIEMVFPHFLQEFKNWKNDPYIDFIIEYLSSELKTPHLETSIMVNWNTLEHLANYFCKSKKKTKILKHSKFTGLRNLVKKEYKIKKSHIAFPCYEVEDVQKLEFIHNIPSIRKKILFLNKEIQAGLDKSEENLIRNIKWLRDKLFHKESSLKNLQDEFARRQNIQNFEYEDFNNYNKDIICIIEKFLLKIFNLTASYLKSNISNHQIKLEWDLDPDLIVTFIEESELEAKFKTEKEKLYPLIDFLDNLECLLEHLMSTKELKGILVNPSLRESACINKDDQERWKMIIRTRRNMKSVLEHPSIFRFLLNNKFLVQIELSVIDFDSREWNIEEFFTNIPVRHSGEFIIHSIDIMFNSNQVPNSVNQPNQ